MPGSSDDAQATTFAEDVEVEESSGDDEFSFDVDDVDGAMYESEEDEDEDEHFHDAEEGPSEGADADDETRDILRQQKRTVARVVVASVVAIMSTFFTLPFPMIYGYVRPNFWRKRSMVFLVTFIVDSVVNDLCLMAVAFVDVKEDEKTSAAAVPIHPAPDFAGLT